MTIARPSLSYRFATRLVVAGIGDLIGAKLSQCVSNLVRLRREMSADTSALDVSEFSVSRNSNLAAK